MEAPREKELQEDEPEARPKETGSYLPHSLARGTSSGHPRGKGDHPACCWCGRLWPHEAGGRCLGECLFTHQKLCSVSSHRLRRTVSFGLGNVEFFLLRLPSYSSCYGARQIF